MNLTRADIDYEKREILVYGSKTDRYRMVPMTERVFTALKEQDRAIKTRHMFTRRKRANTREGTLFDFNYRWIHAIWFKVQLHMGWKTNDQHTLYLCRHTFASRLIQNDVPLPIITELMGHASYQQTLHYAKLKGGQGKAAITTLEGLV
jgi:integrase